MNSHTLHLKTALNEWIIIQEREMNKDGSYNSKAEYDAAQGGSWGFCFLTAIFVATIIVMVIK